MSGPIHTIKNYLITGSSGNELNQRTYEGVALFFDTHPGYQRIAWNTGSIDGNNAFKVWRAVSGTQKFDVILRWSYTDYWDAWSVYSDYGVGLAVGAHDSGEAWNGTTNNPNDVPAVPPFKPTSIVMARQVACGGNITASKDAFHLVGPGNTIPHYMLMNGSGDNDSFTFIFDEDNNGTNNFLLHFERFIPVNSDYTFPFFFYGTGAANSNYFQQTTTYGELGLVASDDACLVYVSASAGNITGTLPVPERAQVDYAHNYAIPFPISTSYLPYVLEYPILLISMETGGEYVGYLNALRKTWHDIPNYSRLGNQSRLVISQSVNAAVPTLTMHWSGTAASGSSYSASMFLTGTDVFGRSGQSGYFIDRLGTTDSMVTVVSQTIVTNNYLYRGRVGATYVFEVGSPPAGATDIVIMGIV